MLILTTLIVCLMTIIAEAQTDSTTTSIYNNYNYTNFTLGRNSVFNILIGTALPGCYCRLAVDIKRGNRSNCVGNRLALYPHKLKKKSQQWQWRGSLLRNRQNGFVWSVNDTLGSVVVLDRNKWAHWQDFEFKNNRLYRNYFNSSYPYAIGVKNTTRLIGASLTLQESDDDDPRQYFEYFQIRE